MLSAIPLAMDSNTVSEEFQTVEIQCNTILKQKYAEVGVPDFNSSFQGKISQIVFLIFAHYSFLNNETK